METVFVMAWISVWLAIVVVSIATKEQYNLDISDMGLLAFAIFTFLLWPIFLLALLFLGFWLLLKFFIAGVAQPSKKK